MPFSEIPKLRPEELRPSEHEEYWETVKQLATIGITASTSAHDERARLGGFHALADEWVVGSVERALQSIVNESDYLHRRLLDSAYSVSVFGGLSQRAVKLGPRRSRSFSDLFGEMCHAWVGLSVAPEDPALASRICQMQSRVAYDYRGSGYLGRVELASMYDVAQILSAPWTVRHVGSMPYIL